MALIGFNAYLIDPYPYRSDALFIFNFFKKKVNESKIEKLEGIQNNKISFRFEQFPTIPKVPISHRYVLYSC
jgi:hypothetical protein